MPQTPAATDIFYDLQGGQKVKAIDPSDPLVTLKPRTPFHTHICSNHVTVQKAVKKRAAQKKAARFEKAISADALMTHIQDLVVHEWVMKIDGRFLLNGYAGSRAMSRLRRAQKQKGSLEKSLDVSFQSDVPIFEPTNAFDPNLPIVLECRQKNNYYHFIVETLSLFPSLVANDYTGAILIHCNDANQAGFADAFVKTLFPGLADRVEFVSNIDPVSYDTALLPFDLRHVFPTAEGGVCRSGDLSAIAAEDRDQLFSGQLSARQVQANFIPEGLYKLREHALKTSEALPKTLTPKRIFVDRKQDKSRPRPTEGIEKLRPVLKEIGFETVYFEELSPLAQIQMMHQAEICVAIHGAGLTNMLFASPKTRMIELANVDSTDHRWDNFIRLAEVAGCDYHKVYADAVGEDPSDVNYKGLRPIALTDVAIVRVAELVEDYE